MQISDTIYDLLGKAKDLIERKNGVTLDPEKVKDNVFFMDSKTALDPTATLESLKPEFEPKENEFRHVAFVVKSKTHKRTPTQQHFPVAEIKDGYFIHMLWDKCQIDYKVNRGVNLIDVLKKAQEEIEERRKLTFKIEDAWDHVFYRGEKIDDTRTLLSSLADVTPNDPLKPIHISVDMSVQVGKTASAKQDEFIEEMEERQKTEPMYYCHVFWDKHFLSIHVPVSSTCLELLQSTKRVSSLKSKLKILISKARATG